MNVKALAGAWQSPRLVKRADIFFFSLSHLLQKNFEQQTNNNMLRIIGEQLQKLEDKLLGQQYRSSDSETLHSYYSIVDRLERLCRDLNDLHKKLKPSPAPPPQIASLSIKQLQGSNLVDVDSSVEGEVVNVCETNNAKIYTSKHGSFMKHVGTYANVQDFLSAYDAPSDYDENQKKILHAILQKMNYSDVPFQLHSFGSEDMKVHKSNKMLGKDIEFSDSNKEVRVVLEDGNVAWKPLQKYYPPHDDLEYILIYDSKKDKVTVQDFQGFERENFVFDATLDEMRKADEQDKKIWKEVMDKHGVSTTRPASQLTSEELKAFMRDIKGIEKPALDLSDDTIKFQKKTRFFYMPERFKQGGFWIPTKNITANGWVWENRNLYLFNEDAANSQNRGFILVNWL